MTVRDSQMERPAYDLTVPAKSAENSEVQKTSRKYCNRSRLYDPHGRYTVTPPWQHRSATGQTPFARARRSSGSGGWKHRKWSNCNRLCDQPPRPRFRHPLRSSVITAAQTCSEKQQTGSKPGHLDVIAFRDACRLTGLASGRTSAGQPEATDLAGQTVQRPNGTALGDRSLDQGYVVR